MEKLAPPGTSAPHLKETTVCHAYLCPFAYGCGQRRDRPAQVLKRRCMRFLPDAMRIPAGLSDMALDLLARQRQVGQEFAAPTRDMLDRLRPHGPFHVPRRVGVSL